MNAPHFKGDGAVAHLLSELLEREPTMLSCVREVNMGSGDVIARGTAAGSRRFVLFKAQGRDSQNTRVATVFVSLAEFTPGLASRVGNVVAFVNGGSGGGRFSVEVDVGQGVQFSLPASTMEVAIELQAMPDGDFASFDSVQVSAGVAWGTRAAADGATTRTQGPFIVADGATVDVPVPPFGYAVQALVAQPAWYQAGAGRVRYLGADLPAPGGVLADFDSSVALDAIANGSGMRFGGLVRAVQFENGSGAPIRISPVFALNL